MKRDFSIRTLLVVVAMLLTLNIASTLVASNPEPAPMPAFAKLEYKIWRGEKAIKGIQAKMTQFGKNGWQLIGIVDPSHDKPMFILSRPAQ